jgi:hypothetical protein
LEPTLRVESNKVFDTGRLLDLTINIRLGANVLKPYLTVIFKFLYSAGGFIRLGWKSLSGTNTLAYYEN